MAVDARVHRITTAQYERIVTAGALDDARVELLDGLLVDVSPQGELHARVIRRLMEMFVARMDLLRVQMPLAVTEGWVPEPDVALVEHDEDPDLRPTTALIVVEVAISSQEEARRKAPAYASARIPRYWLVDVPAGIVIEYTQPRGGRYGCVARLRGADTLDAGVAGVDATTVDRLLSWRAENPQA
jgi:Uma2 family endonuclease